MGTKTVTNQTSGTSAEQAHLPFGRPLDAESTLQNNNNRFTSYDRSDKTSLDYAVNRTYDSKLGRFTQVDPIGMRAVSLAAPQTLNMYSYCGNDPINNTDPSGLFWGFFKKLFKWVMVAVAVVVAIMTIVAAPFTIAGILGMISAASGAASSVLGALGYNKAAMIFGLVAVATGFGSLIAGHIAAKQAAAAAAARTPGGFSLPGANFASEAAKTFKDAAMFGILSGVGAVVNNLADKRKKETPEQRRKRLIKSAINTALWRLRNMPGCKDYIQMDSPHDAVTSLEGLKSADRVVYDSTLNIPEQVSGADAGKGPNSKIRLGDVWFEEGVGGWTGTMNAPRTRTNIVLHGLKHAVEGRDHAPGEANNHYYNEIAKKCFGINP